MVKFDLSTVVVLLHGWQIRRALFCVQLRFSSIVIPRYLVVVLYGMLVSFIFSGVMVVFFCFL